MSYTDYFTLINLGNDVRTGKLTFSKAVELAEMCLGVKMSKEYELNETCLKVLNYPKSIESWERTPEYSRRFDAIIDFEIKFGIYAERDSPSGRLNV